MLFSIVESDWRATNTTSTTTISPNTSNQNFEIAILFNVVVRSGNYVFGDKTPLIALMARVVRFCPGSISGLNRKGDCINYRRAFGLLISIFSVFF